MSEETPPKRSDHLPPLFAMYWLAMQRRARELGYCLALHGSLVRDFDAVAIPWTDEAVSADDLADALAQLVGWVPGSVETPAVKPHGRLAYSIWLADDRLPGETPMRRHLFLDLSVVPRAADWSKFA